MAKLVEDDLDRALDEFRFLYVAAAPVPSRFVVVVVIAALLLVSPAAEVEGREESRGMRGD